MRYHAAFRHRITFNFRPHALLDYLNTEFQSVNTLLFTPTIIISQPLITMPSTYSNTSFFEDPYDIDMDDLSLLKWPIHIKKSLWSIQSTFKCDRAPVKKIPGIPQLALYDNPITPNIPIDPPSLHVYDPSNRIIWEKTFQR